MIKDSKLIISLSVTVWETRENENKKREMMQAILNKLGHIRNKRVKKTNREWMGW